MTYRLLANAISPLFATYTVWRATRDGGPRYLQERFGYFKSAPVHQQTHWIHAASVGEVLTILPLIKALPDHGVEQILVTTNTPTGASILEQQALAFVQHAYLPIDLKGATRRFISHFKPQSVWITETEIWPWIYARCHASDIQITIINGRLSSRTTTHSKGILASSFQHALRGVRVLARSAEDSTAYHSLGADSDKIKTVGNLKYANAFSHGSAKRLLERDYVVAASTHADEELQLAIHWSKTENNALLVIVPRHPERGESIQKSLQSAGLASVRRSSGQNPSSVHRIYIADTLGEMADWFAFARGAFVGGSLIPRGGHNILEPARFACPSIVGIHTHNFDDVVTQMKKADALRIAQDASEVARFLHSTLIDNEVLKQMGNRARQIANNSEEVLQLYLKLLLEPSARF